MKNRKQLPSSIYRLQFNHHMTFHTAKEIVDYLHTLGITHCYASPIWLSKSGSLHGYDIKDHTKLNPELGTDEDFSLFVQSLRTRSMGLIIDIVPNHVYIADATNPWWKNVLENGRASPYADYFDIDWKPIRTELVNKILLPLLDQNYGESLENQKIKLTYCEGSFSLELYDHLLPTDPKSWNAILEPLIKEGEGTVTPEDANLLELKSIISSLSHLPSTTEKDIDKIEERQREKEIIKIRLGKVFTQSPVLLNLLVKKLQAINGTIGNSKSFDELEAFINAQTYWLCYWRVANNEINYRRFFDVFEFAGLRLENPKVFTELHSLLFQLIEKGDIDGIRVDHIDGLWNPEYYLRNLQRLWKQAREGKDSDEGMYLVVEKILLGNEKLNPEWPISGTVGYDFLNQLNRIYVFQNNKLQIIDIYRHFTGINSHPNELVYDCKALILLSSMSSELQMLVRRLSSIAFENRNTRDFTADTLQASLRSIIAYFAVYRSYINAEDKIIHEVDRKFIQSAIAKAKRRNPYLSPSIFDFIKSILLLEHPSELNQDQQAEREAFVMRFQQLTGPVMAKGLEDTAFYRYYPLSSLLEVGAELSNFGNELSFFHQKNRERLDDWPHAMTTTSTHDTKRSEDVRARINVLSEIPEQWEQALARWSEYNRPFKHDNDDEAIPNDNEEYLLYQTLIGTWPYDSMNREQYQEYVQRIQHYMEKAIKEAKIDTSWINPNPQYEEKVHQFVQEILDRNAKENPFLADFENFHAKVRLPGVLNSLSQLVVKLTSPGIPDIYQGNELWDFSLVDPDNRHPVDFQKRIELIKTLPIWEKGDRTALLKELLLHFEDGRIKLWITICSLHARQRHSELFSKGSYEPLIVKGDKANHIIAFARTFEGKTVITITTRFFTHLLQNDNLLIDTNTWSNTSIELSPDFTRKKYRDIFSNREIESRKNKDGAIVIELHEALNPLPMVILEGVEEKTQ